MACLWSCQFASCGLIYDYPDACGDIGLTISNDWSAAPDASPQGMAYIFYGNDDAQPWRFDFPGAEAGAVMLPEGLYGFVSYSDDSYHILFDGDSYSTLKAHTWPARLPHDADGARNVVESPDMLWGCTYCKVDVSYDGLSYIPSFNSCDDAVWPEDNVLTAHQRQITPHYRLRIDEVENLGGVSSMSGALSGMAGGYVFSSGRVYAYPYTLTFAAGAIDDTTIGGDFCTFGLPENPDEPNTLYLFVRLVDGRAFEYRFDVTDQVRNAPDPMSVLIALRGLVLEKPDSGAQGGFDVGVDGWITVDVDIND